MLIGHDAETACGHVEFVSYTGKWPSLCAGILTLRVDGREMTFGDQDKFAKKLPDGSAPDHPKFWSTGGECRMPPDEITLGEWIVDARKLPQDLQEYADEVDQVFNRHVEHGCCGGCR